MTCPNEDLDWGTPAPANPIPAPSTKKATPTKSGPRALHNQQRKPVSFNSKKEKEKEKAAVLKRLSAIDEDGDGAPNAEDFHRHHGQKVAMLDAESEGEDVELDAAVQLENETLSLGMKSIGDSGEGDGDEDEPTTAPDPNFVDDEDDEEKGFMAIKPWLGAMCRPTNCTMEFTEEDNNWEKPELKLDLDYVFGYRSRNSRQNLHWIDEKKIVFPAAAVGVVLDLETTDQDFFFGHDDDIVCLDYHSGRRLAASGSIGARNEVRLCIWKVDGIEPLPLDEVKCFQGFHMYAVTAVAFSPDGSMVCSVGMDEHHSVAIYAVDGDSTTALRAVSPSDKSRVIHVKYNTSAGIDSNACFVTVGVKHVCFWTPAKPSTKSKHYYLMDSDDPVEQRLVWQRGVGCKEIDDLIFHSVSFSTLYTLVGATNGCVYVFSSAGFEMLKKVLIEDNRRILSLLELNQSGDTFAVGCGSGRVSFYDINNAPLADVSMTPSAIVNTKDAKPLDLNSLDEATDNPSDVHVNSVRSLAYLPSADKLLVGTILSQIYSISLTTSLGGKPQSKTLLSGHWGSLAEKEGYGEMWGVTLHPYKQHVYTCADDGTVRLWDIIDNNLLARMNLKYRCYRIDAANNGKMVTIGHRNGSFTVLDGGLQCIVHPNTRHRKREVDTIKFAPNSRLLAVGADQYIDIYAVKSIPNENVKKNFARIAICRGHTSLVAGMDWNVSSTLLQSYSNGYELLYFAKDGARVTGTRQLADQQWFTQTCILGWGVQGIWPRFADGSDINSVSRSRCESYLALTDDWGHLKLYNYPCVGSGLNRLGHLDNRPDYHYYVGHCSHVTNCAWSFDDSYVITTGGADLCFMAWKAVYPDPSKKPKALLNAAYIDKFEAEVKKARDESTKREAEQKKKRAAERQRRIDAGESVPPEVEEEGRIDPSLDDPLASLQPKQCIMCGHTFQNFEVQSCPRCFTPRRLIFSEPHAAWGTSKKVHKYGSALPPKHLRKKFEVAGRHNLPTKSFASATREQQKVRKALEETSKPKTWQPNSSSAPLVSCLPKVHEDPDTDDELLKKKVVSTAKKMGPKRKVEKRCAGPDYNDY